MPAHDPALTGAHHLGGTPSEAPLIPEGGVLVHIGPYKTGTSAVQGAMHARRDELRGQGVLYPGPTRRPLRPVAALLGRPPRGVAPVPLHEWEDFAEEIRRTTTRVCVSNESLAGASAAKAQELVDALGRERVHVVMTARRLDRLLPSAWQQRVQSSNEALSYADWLDQVLADDVTGVAGRAFWHGQSLEALLERWGSCVPPERITVVIADETDRGRLLRIFETMLGLPLGLLTLTDRDNASLTWEGVELARALNRAFDENGWADWWRLRLIQDGLVVGLRGADVEDATRLPGLDVERAKRVADLSRRRSEVLRGSGVRIVGEPDALMPVFEDDAPSSMAGPPTTVSIDAASHALVGVVAEAVRSHDRAEERFARTLAAAATPSVETLTARQLAAELGMRARRRLTRGLRHIPT